VSEKMECPGCHAATSSVRVSVMNGDPCPYCGLSADAVLEINVIRRKQADDELKERLATALAELDRLRAEAARLRGQVASARRALGCEHPGAPHVKEPDG
jgi:hypothetical protein